MIGLYDIDPVARKAELRTLLGEKKYRGKGYGTEATALITFYGFDRLNLNRIFCGYVSENVGAGRVPEKTGFEYEGLLKSDYYRNSRYYDIERSGVLRENYYEK